MTTIVIIQNKYQRLRRKNLKGFTAKGAIMTAHEATGKTIRALREKRGMSQNHLADRMECERSYISKIENGYSLLNFTQLRRFAAALGTPAWNLLRCVEQRLDGSTQRDTS